MCLGRIKKFVCDKLSVFGGENTNVGKINCPGMKMSAWSLSDATLQSKLKGRKRTFREKGISRFISEKEKEGFSTISHIYEREKGFPFRTCLKTLAKCFKDDQLLSNLTLCSVGTGVACPRCESSCVCTNCSGLRASFHTLRKQLPASRSLRSHRF